MRLEALMTINLHREFVTGLLHTEVGEVTEIPVGEVTMAKGQRIHLVMVFERLGAIVQESANATAVPAVLIYDYRKTIKLPNCVDARASNVPLAILCVPYLEVAAASLRPRRAKLKVCRPLLIL